MDKKRWFLLFCFGILFLFLIGVSAQIIDTSELEKGVEGVRGTAEGVKDFTEKDKWKYLGEQWRETLLKTQYFSSIDRFFRKVNFLFVILLGQDYDFSLVLFVSLALWVVFLLFFISIFSLYTAFSKKVSVAIAVAFNVLVGQLGVFQYVSSLIFKIIFYREGIWAWVSSLILFFAFLFAIIFFRTLFIQEKKIRKSEREFKQKLNQKVLDSTVKSILKGQEAK